MNELRYLRNVATLAYDPDTCTGCGMCAAVCPHGVFSIEGKKVRMIDRDRCMECGACAKNCPFAAISVRAGVGCAWAILISEIRGRAVPSCG